MTRPLNVLILCTGNSARSILAESLVNHFAHGAERAWSAGSRPTGRVNPQAIATLQAKGHPTKGLSSKTWDEFASADAPVMDIVITVCDNAAGETCPVWPGSPCTVHWGIPDPAEDGEFELAYARLRARVEAMLALPLGDMSPAERAAALSRIHEECLREA